MRPAIDVPVDILRAFEHSKHWPYSDEAAAIIEQDRAALVAEIVAWLREDAPQWGHEALAKEIEAKWGVKK